MTRKKRKSLNDSLAREFVYGNSSDDSDDAPDEDSQSTESSNPEPDNPVIEVRPERGFPAHQQAHLSDEPDTPIKKQSKLMDKLQAESKEATKRFTVDLPESTHRKLSILAAKTGRTKADIVRVLINDALDDIPE